MAPSKNSNDTGRDGLDPEIEALLQDITNLPDDALVELRDRVLRAFDARKQPPSDKVVDGDDLDALESLAAAANQIKREQDRRTDLAGREHEAFRAASLLVPESRRPQVLARSRAHALTAGGVGLATADDLAEEFVTALRTHRAPNSQDGRTHVATIRSSRPANRTLGRDDPAAVTDALTAAAERQAEAATTAITAAGGLGAPEDSDYILNGFSVPDRPVKGALPSFTAERGGIRFTRPPLITDVNGAIGVWTVEDDIEAATDATLRKPSFRINVGPEVVVNVQAVTNSLIFGNMVARAFPEFVKAATDVAFAAHARIAEQQLLVSIGALSTHVTGITNATPGMAGLGATRHLLPTLELAAAGMRDRLRYGDSTPLQLILPHWSRGILRHDLALQEPGDSTLGVTNADVDAYLAARNVTPTYALDGEAGQHFNPQSAGPVNGWPDSILCYLFPAGAFQFLDGGTLDVGLVRDSTLNAANDFQMFTETFEAAVFRGGASMRIRQPVTPNGIARAAA